MNYCLRQYELLSRKRLNMNYRLRRYELFACGECSVIATAMTNAECIMHNAELSAAAGEENEISPQPQSSLLALGAHSPLVSVRIRARTAGGIPASRTAHDRTPLHFGYADSALR